MKYCFTIAGVISVILSLIKVCGVNLTWGLVFAPIWITGIIFIIIFSIACLFIGYLIKTQHISLYDLENSLNKLKDMLDEYTKDDE